MANTSPDTSKYAGGATSIHKHPYGLLFTSGVKDVADKTGSHWILVELCLMQKIGRVRREEFQVWKLKVNADRSASLTCEDGNGHVVFFKRKATDYTDFPYDEYTLWVTNRTILLPCEY